MWEAVRNFFVFYIPKNSDIHETLTSQTAKYCSEDDYKYDNNNHMTVCLEHKSF